MIKVTRSVIPSLFTIMNLFSGFIAIKAAMVDSDFVTAGWFILLGAIFDVFDGFMARLTHSASEFGVELDSLADVVTFGVAPSAMLYKLFFFRFGGLGLLVAALPAMCGAIRLARFNVQLVGFDKDYFRGLPIPAAALLIISYAIFYHLHPDPRLASATYDGAMFVVAISASLLMVSTIKYDTMPKPSLRALKAHPINLYCGCGIDNFIERECDLPFICSLRNARGFSLALGSEPKTAYGAPSTRDLRSGGIRRRRKRYLWHLRARSLVLDIGILKEFFKQLS
jgi:CDP-diacylglycerol--serine O-phosphatidyltransferase